MLIDAGAGDTAEVGSKVETMRFVELSEGLLGFGGEGEYLCLLFFG